MTPADVTALRLLLDAEHHDPPGLSIGTATSAEFGTIYHRTAERLLEASIPTVVERLGFEGELARAAGRDRYTRPMIRISVEGVLVLEQIDAEEATP